MNNRPEETAFLATTALEDFWDTSKPIVFLGGWCKRYSRKSYWEKLKARTVVCSTTSSLDEENKFINALYERWLQRLGCSLNRLHGVEASSRYWRILLGPWLHNYLSIMHDHAMTLRAAVSQLPNFTTLLLAEESFVTPSGSGDFNRLFSEDAYNLQLYTKILSYWGHNFPRKQFKVKPVPLYLGEKSSPVMEPIKNLYKRVFQTLEKTLKNSTPIIFESSYFSHFGLFRLFLKIPGKFWAFFHGREATLEYPLETEKRLRLENELRDPSHSDFEQLLTKLLPSDIPQNFIEGYLEMCENTMKKYPKSPELILSANSWYYKDNFKHWAATLAEKGVPLIGTQHGGNYGSLLDHPGEEHELAIVDHFYSWGWKSGALSHKIKPFLATKLATLKNLESSPKRQEGILFGTTITPRYMTLMHTIPWHQFDQYLSWQFRFARSLPPHLLQQLRVRQHCVDYGWDVTQRWQDALPEVRLEDWSIPFSRSLRKCRVYVCDNLSTTFIESLAAGKPTILFWDPQANPLRPEAQPFYDSLASAGILHHSPESAAKHLASVYNDIDSWWNNTNSRNVRQEFCHQFARTSPEAIQEWARELRAMAGFAQSTEEI